MTAESASDRQLQWVLVVRRSFEIPDHVDNEDARRALVRKLEEHLHQNGWQSATRAIAEPMVDALMAFGASGDFDDRLLPVDLDVSSETFVTRDAAHRLIDNGMMTVDPQHLVFDVTSEYPPEVIAVAEIVLDRVFQYAREQSFGE